MSRKTALKPAKRSKVMPSRFRLLPLTIIMAFLMLGVKASDLYRDGNKLRAMLQPSNAFAEEEKADKKAEDMAKDEEHASDEGDAEHTEEKDGEAHGDNESGEMKMSKLDEKTPQELKPHERRDFSQIEIDLLQSLAERREELETRAKEIDLKDKLLDATELRINDKLAEMKVLQVEVSKLLEEYNKHEDAKIKSLVKIYESMKPKQASEIFNELDMPILLEVIDKMSERKVAPVLAGMNPERARAVTEQLAEFRQLRDVPRVLGASK